MLVCVESWLHEKKNINFTGFNTYRKDSIHTSGGGILILIKKHLAYKEIQNVTSPDESIELSGIEINNISPNLRIFICYRTPGCNLEQEKWDGIINTTVRSYSNSILMGDFNAHNTAWNCLSTDTNGERLLQSIDDSDTFLHNVNSLTHIDFYRTKI